MYSGAEGRFPCLVGAGTVRFVTSVRCSSPAVAGFASPWTLRLHANHRLHMGIYAVVYNVRMLDLVTTGPELGDAMHRPDDAVGAAVPQEQLDGGSGR